MSTGVAALSPAKSRSSSGQVSRRAYVFGVSALAVFLAGLLVVPTSQKQYRASATLLLDSPAGEGSALDVVKQTLVDDDTLRKVLAKLGPPRHAASFFTEKYPPYSELERVRQSLHFELLSPGLTNRPRVRITATGFDPDRAIVLIEELVAASAESAPSNQPSNGAQTDGSIELLVKEESIAREQLDGFLNEHFHETVPKLQQSLETAVQSIARGGDFDHSATAIDSQPEQPAAGTTAINPAWVKLNEQLDELTKKRDELLTKFTTLHPQVFATDAEIADIQRKLDTTPRVVENPAPLNDPPPRVAESPPPTSNVVRATTLLIDPSSLTGLMPDFDRLQARFTASRENLAAALQVVNGAGDFTGSRAVHLAESPQISGRWGGLPSTIGVGMVGMIAIGLGGFMVWSAGTPVDVKKTFANAGEVQQTLGLPVVAELSTGESPPSPADGARQLWGRRIIRGCELTLALLVSAFLITSLLDSPFLAEAVENPLGAVPQMARRLTELL